MSERSLLRAMFDNVFAQPRVTVTLFGVSFLFIWFAELTRHFGGLLSHAGTDVAWLTANVTSMLVLVALVFLPFSAVAWHRYVIHGERPSLAGWSGSFKRAIRYTVDWIVIGLGIGLVLALFSVVKGVIMGAVSSIVGGQLFDLFYVFGIVIYIVPTLLICRFGMGLVHYATHDQWINFMPSWRQSRQGARGLVWAALFCALLPGVLRWLEIIGLRYLMGLNLGGDSVGVEYSSVIALGFVEALATLLFIVLELSLLTEVYRRSRA